MGVIDRPHPRNVVLSSVFGRKQILKVVINNCKKFYDDTLLRFLPRPLQLALGTGFNIDKTDRDLPFELESVYPPKKGHKKGEAESVPKDEEAELDEGFKRFILSRDKRRAEAM